MFEKPLPTNLAQNRNINHCISFLKDRSEYSRITNGIINDHRRTILCPYVRVGFYPRTVSQISRLADSAHNCETLEEVVRENVCVSLWCWSGQTKRSQYWDWPNKAELVRKRLPPVIPWSLSSVYQSMLEFTGKQLLPD